MVHFSSFSLQPWGLENYFSIYESWDSRNWGLKKQTKQKNPHHQVQWYLTMRQISSHLLRGHWFVSPLKPLIFLCCIPIPSSLQHYMVFLEFAWSLILYLFHIMFIIRQTFSVTWTCLDLESDWTNVLLLIYERDYIPRQKRDHVIFLTLATSQLGISTFRAVAQLCACIGRNMTILFMNKSLISVQVQA